MNGDCVRRGVEKRGRKLRSGRGREAKPVHGIENVVEVIAEFALEVLVHFLEFEETRSYAS